MKKEFLHSIFAMAQTDIRVQPFNNFGRTLRLIVDSNINAHALSIRFANFLGNAPLTVGAASVALCDEKGVLQPDTLRPLTCGGLLQFTIQPGKDIMSDTLKFSVRPGEFFALNIYYPTDERVNSGNWVSNTALRSRPGNFSADLKMSSPSFASRLSRTITISNITVSVTSVAEIIAHSKKPTRVVGCFGDSITQQGNWFAPLEKLLHHTYPGEISLCNLGISGNRLLYDSPDSLGGLNGISGMERFERDLLALDGLTHAILELGTNDIGLPGSHGVPESEMIDLPQYIEAMTQLASRLHEKNIKAYVATLSPRPIVRPYTEEREVLRHQMNEWLRSTSIFDGVLDFDAVLRRDDGKPGMQDGYHLPDGLHPSTYGGLWIAKSIDLSLFGGAPD